MAISAQETCIINGTIAHNDAKVKKVSLTYTDEFGQSTTVATAKVKRGRYTFTYSLPADAPVLRYTITGMGHGHDIALFVEPGEVVVSTPSATQSAASTVSGTPTNDTYAAYKAIAVDAQSEADRQVAHLASLHGSEWLACDAGKREVKRIMAQQSIKREAESLRFLIDHNASPMTPWVIEHMLLSKLTAAYAEQMTKAVATSLHQHPYYLSLRNAMLASTLKVGGEAPDITLPMLNGDTRHLTDFRGKHVLLHFWTDANESAALMAELKSVYQLIREQPDQFVILSLSLSTDASAWRESVASLGLDLAGWFHACDGAGMQSPAALRYGVVTTPRIVLIEPEGHAASLDMETDEIVMRIEQILSGDLYYLDQKE